MRDCIGNGPGSMLVLGGGGGETHGFSSMRGNMDLFIQDKILLGGGRRPIQIIGGGAVRPPPLPVPIGVSVI